jgi:nicotinamide-nucleotide amidase
MKKARTAACVAVGSELLGEGRVDSNSFVVIKELGSVGVSVVEKRVVGDNEEQIARTVAELCRQVDVVVLTGGLGPTADDVTRQGLAQALGRKLEVDREVELSIERRYADAGRSMPEICRRMAQVIPGSRPLSNELGAAPGIMIEHDSCLVVALPGVPCEMRAMLSRDVVPELARRSKGQRRLSRTLLFSGVMESVVESRVQPLYAALGRENITILASCGLVRLILTATGSEEEAVTRLDMMERAIREVVGEDLAAVDCMDLATVVLAELARRHQSLATAESCTGGLIGARITAVAGASAVYSGGVVSYSNQAKEELLDVPSSLLELHGAVSRPVAEAMAIGVRARFHTDWGVSVTGIAGPTGGTPEKPVGLVHWAVAGPGGLWARHGIFPGDRERIREWSLSSALDLLRRRVIGDDG